jgi:FdhD protein
MDEPISEFPVWRYREGRLAASQDQVAVEEPLEIRLCGEPFQVLMRLPGWEKELALGFLHTEGIVRDLNEVNIYTHPHRLRLERESPHLRAMSEPPRV